MFPAWNNTYTAQARVYVSLYCVIQKYLPRLIITHLSHGPFPIFMTFAHLPSFYRKINVISKSFTTYINQITKLKCNTLRHLISTIFELCRNALKKIKVCFEIQRKLFAQREVTFKLLDKLKQEEGWCP